MKKFALCTVLAIAFFLPAAVYSIPMHNICLNFGAAFPGNAEIGTYYGKTIPENFRTYVFGVSYDFAPIEYASIGAGLDVSMMGGAVAYTYGSDYVDNFFYTALEPFARVRGYLPLPFMAGLDVFAGGGIGYALLAGSTFKDAYTPRDTALEGGALTYRVGGGVSYWQDMYSVIIDAGYKSLFITPSSAVASPLPGGGNLSVNLGGFYFTISAALSFGNPKEAREEGETKKELEKEVNQLDTTGADEAGSPESAANTGNAVSMEGAELEPMDEKNYDAPQPEPSRVKAGIADPSFLDDIPMEESAAEKPAAAETPAAAATEVPAADPEQMPTEQPVKEIPAADVKEQVKVDENPDDTEGIIILMPGESESAELEKYITGKNKQFRQVEDEEEGGAAGEEVVFEYEPEDSGVIVVETESKGTVDKAGYVLVEKGGFISSNFAEDGFIYSLDEHKELIVQGDFAYIKLTAGIGAPKGKQFTVFDDSEEVVNQATGEMMGKMIKFLGVAKVTGPIEDNIFKVQILRSYDPIRNNYKIKARGDLKKYHKEINLKVRKKKADVRAVIIKVKDDVKNLKSRDLVYIDAGISKGLLPGEKLGIFRQATDKATGAQSEYNRIGTLIILNAMQGTATGLILKSDVPVNAGDIVKTAGK